MKRMVAFLMVALMALACTGAALAESETYKFALYAPLTGDNAQYGQTYQKAIEIYIDELNAGGGIDGHPVELEVYDDKNDAREALNIANLIVSDPDVIGVIGSQTSSCCLAAAPVFQEEGIPMITPQGSHVDITLIGDKIFRMTPINTFECGSIASLMIKEGAQKVAIIYATDDYGLAVEAHWRSVMEEAGVEVVAAETFITGQTKDFSPLISKIKALEPDALYIEPSYSDAALILNQMAQLDCEFAVYGSSMLYKNEFLGSVSAEAAQGMKLVNYTLPTNPEETYVKLATEYEAQTGKMVDLYATNAYDCIKLMCDAVAAVGPDGDAMAAWMAGVVDWQGSSGVINFDESRNPSKSLFVFTVADGEFVYDEEATVLLNG